MIVPTRRKGNFQVAFADVSQGYLKHIGMI